MPTGPGGDRSRRRPLPGVGPRTRRRKLPDQSVAGYTEVTWAEDRATRGRDPSAEPGAKTGVGGRTPPLGIPGIGRKAINPITCICISEWRSENQGLSRARRAGKVAGSKAIMPGCMRFRRTTCAALMVLQKRPCFCSPAARPDICPDLRGETAQHKRGEPACGSALSVDLSSLPRGGPFRVGGLARARPWRGRHRRSTRAPHKDGQAGETRPCRAWERDPTRAET